MVPNSNVHIFYVRKKLAWQPVQERLLSRWIQDLPSLKLLATEGDGGNKLINHKGKVGQLENLHKELLAWVEEY